MTLESYVQGFGCLPNPTSYADANSVVLPAPLDWGNGEMPGVALGPMAILGASRFAETFDAELGLDPLELGTATLNAIDFIYDTEERPLKQMRDAVQGVLRDGKKPLCLGGERTIAHPIAQAAREFEKNLGVAWLTRRPGLLDTDAGRKYAPATVGRRLMESGPCVVLGARFWSAAEQRKISAGKSPPIVVARTLEQQTGLPDTVLKSLPRNIHLSIDVGVLDPAFLPMAGNIEPGGLSWFKLTSIVDELFVKKNVVSCDISGFAPTIGAIAPSLVVAQLVLRCLCHMTSSTGEADE